jgi:hypothetical protein
MIGQRERGAQGDQAKACTIAKTEAVRTACTARRLRQISGSPRKASAKARKVAVSFRAKAFSQRAAVKKACAGAISQKTGAGMFLTKSHSRLRLP